jgi:DNA-directed RNA polymerase subunit RPC12/RpoP
VADLNSFGCPQCGERLQLGGGFGGRSIKCPKCANTIVVPQEGDEPAAISPGNSSAQKTIDCPACRLPNAENNYRCTNCGAELHVAPMAVPAIPIDDQLAIFIPYRNAPALWAYYLGVFALIPCFGFFLGIAAIILGIKGASNARKHPEAKGGVHSWVGIILGSLVVLGHLAVIAAIAIAQSR